jgi:hypothetical protein
MLKGMYGVTTATYAAIRELILPSYAQDSTIGVIKDKEGNLKYHRYIFIFSLRHGSKSNCFYYC